jgi:hypothetical protein
VVSVTWLTGIVMGCVVDRVENARNTFVYNLALDCILHVVLYHALESGVYWCVTCRVKGMDEGGVRIEHFLVNCVIGMHYRGKGCHQFCLYH